MSRLFTPGRKPLLVPGTSKRVLHRPDGRGLISPYVSAAPLSVDEVDYDDLDILRTWRVYETQDPGQIRYFCYELAQRDVGENIAQKYFKVVRLIRLTRVPRYLRQMPEYEQMRDVLVAMRERRVLFLNLIAKSPKLPLIFSYGVQGVGDTLEEACDQADEAFAALSFCLDGTYQQLEYEPLTVDQGEHLARYQAEWNHIAMARGRPIPRGTPVGSQSLLDSNRTDVSNMDALENFIRGMSSRSFMLSLVTVPLSPEDMATAWRNLTPKVSAVRSDQQGSRGVTASIALPMGLGTSSGFGSGTTHGLTGTEGTGMSQGVSQSHTDGTSFSHTDGTSFSHTDGTSASTSQVGTQGHSTSTALGHSVTDGQSITHGQSASANQSHTLGANQSQGVTDSVSHGVTVGQSHTSTDSVAVGHSQTTSESTTVGQSSSTTHGVSTGQSEGVSSGQSLAAGSTAGSNWSNSANQSSTSGQSLTDGTNQSASQNQSQAWSVGAGSSDGAGHSAGSSNSSGVSGGIGGINGQAGVGTTLGDSTNTGANHSSGVSQTGGGSNTTGTSSSLTGSLSQSVGQGESAGGSVANSLTSANSVGTNSLTSFGESMSSTTGTSTAVTQGVAQSLSQTLGHAESIGQSIAQSQGVGQSLSHTQGTSASATTGTGQGQSLSQGQTLARGASLSQGATDSTSLAQGTSQGVSKAATSGTSAASTGGVSSANTAGASAGASQQQAMSEAYMVAMSRQQGMSGSFGIMPGLAASISRQTLDAAKKSIGDMLEAQLNRLHEGIEGGGMLYQMFLVTPDRSTLIGGSALLKDSFWGAGKDDARLPVPFHTIVIDDDIERDRLLTHAAAFTHYRRREPVSEIIEPHMYSSYVTAGEASAFSHPPTSEALGIQTQTDSMPVLAMPNNRQGRDIYLGRIVNGERGRVDEARFGVDLNELTHILVQGVTGTGKTTTMMRLLEQAVHLERDVITPPTPANPVVTAVKARAGVLCLDWMQNMRDLAGIVEPERFQLFSVAKPNLGRFRWNPLAIPHPTMDPGQWIGAQADNLASAMGLGQVGRSVLAEYIDRLYSANRLEPVVLREAVIAADGSGVVLRPAEVLPPIDRSTLPAGVIRTDGTGAETVNVYSFPELSRLVSLSHVAVMVQAMAELLATPDGGRQFGTAMRDRINSVWRRIQFYMPGAAGAAVVAPDPDLTTRQCLGVTDIVDPARGLVTVIEADGLDLENRRIILGSVMLAIYRYGLHVGKGCFDHHGAGPGTFLVLEEAHELFGTVGESEDRESATIRANLYESMFRRARATGLRLVAITQNCSAIPAAITSQTSTVLVHRTIDGHDRERVFDLLNWSNQIGQQIREWRYLGEMATGYCIARLDAKTSYLESAPVQLLVDPAALPPVGDDWLEHLARQAGHI